MMVGVKKQLFLSFKFAIVAIVICSCTDGAKAAGTQYYGKLLGRLSELHHAVSGVVYAVDGRTLYIKDFTYDGQAPAAYFYAGNSKLPSGSGFRIRDEHGSSEQLKLYRGKSITLTLPEGKTLNQIRWFSVWCDEFSVNFGDVKIPKNFDFPKPQKIEALNGVHGISSDKIVIVDAQTLLIPNLSFDGEAPDAKFWVGRGAKPSPQGIRVPDENGKEVPLRKYDRKTVVLTLPGDLTVFDIGHFGIWCEAFTVDFGHVIIPGNLNVPPSLKMLGVSPQSKLNCEVLNDELAFEVRWAIAGDSIVVQLVSKLEDNEYMSFGISGDAQHSVMVGGDVTVAWVDKNSLKGYAVDYFLDAKSQCAGTRGSCPDERISSNTNSVRLLNAAMVNGYSIVTYQRTLKPADHLDNTILTNKSQPIIWAVGPLNQRNEVSFHTHYLKGDQFIHFGRQPKWNCPMPESDRPHTTIAPLEVHRAQATRGGNRFKNLEPDAVARGSSSDRTETNSRGSTRQHQTEKRQPPRTSPTSRTVPTPKPVTKRDAWLIPPIQCYEPDDGVFYAQMGPTGGKRGYPAITGHVGWGISWYINGLLIPEINVIRGKTYTFVVEGGHDPEIPARYHPFYITDDSVGGYEHKTPEEKSKIQIFAGAAQAPSGEIYPTGTGRLCHWTPKGNVSPDDFASFGGYQRTLELICDPGEPGIITWTPDANTPDTVYYQCFSHRYLGWKINVLDSCDIEPDASELVPSYETAPVSSAPIAEDMESGDAFDDFKASPSIRVETRVNPNTLFLSSHMKNFYNMDTYDKNTNGYGYIYELPQRLPSISETSDFKPSPLIVTSALIKNSASSQPTHTEALTITEPEHNETVVTEANVEPEIITSPLPEQINNAANPTEKIPTTMSPETETTISQLNISESKTTPNKFIFTKPPIAFPFVRHPAKTNYGLENNSPLRPPMNIMRPPFLSKPMHAMGPRFGVTNRPVYRPPYMNPNFAMKKPFFRGPIRKRPIMMSTGLRPVNLFPSKHYNHKPIMMLKPQFPLKETSVFVQSPPPHFMHSEHSFPKIISQRENLTDQIIHAESNPHTFFENLPEYLKHETQVDKIVNKTPKKTIPLEDIKPVEEIEPKDILKSHPQVHEFLFAKITAPSPPPILSVELSNDQSPTEESLSSSKMISIKPDFRKSFTTMRPAINTGFHPDSVVIEGGFLPIISKPDPVAQDRISEVELESVSDNIGVIDLTHSNHRPLNDYSQQSTETFEPMFIPSPPDSQSEHNATTAFGRRNDNLKKIPILYSRQPPVYLKYISRSDQKQFGEGARAPVAENPDGDEMVMAAERIDTFYLPPSNVKYSTPKQPTSVNVPSGTVVSYDGKPIPDVSLPAPPNSGQIHRQLTKIEQLIRSTPQFGSFKGELPPPVPENPNSQVQLHASPRSTPIHLTKFTNSQQFLPVAETTVSTKLSLVENLSLTPRRRREAHHSPEHTAQQEHEHSLANQTTQSPTSSAISLYLSSNQPLLIIAILFIVSQNYQ